MSKKYPSCQKVDFTVVVKKDISEEDFNNSLAVLEKKINEKRENIEFSNVEEIEKNTFNVSFNAYCIVEYDSGDYDTPPSYECDEGFWIDDKYDLEKFVLDELNIGNYEVTDNCIGDMEPTHSALEEERKAEEDYFFGKVDCFVERDEW